MSYEEDYTERVEIPEEMLSEAQKIIISGFMREGEIVFREAALDSMQKDLDKYLEEVDGPPNDEWINGFTYAMHLIKSMEIANA